MNGEKDKTNEWGHVVVEVFSWCILFGLIVAGVVELVS